MTSSAVVRLLAPIAAAAALAGCGGDDDASTSGTTPLGGGAPAAPQRAPDEQDAKSVIQVAVAGDATSGPFKVTGAWRVRWTDADPAASLTVLGKSGKAVASADPLANASGKLDVRAGGRYRLRLTGVKQGKPFLVEALDLDDGR